MLLQSRHFAFVIPRLRTSAKCAITVGYESFRSVKQAARTRTGVLAVKKFREHIKLLTGFRGMTALWDARGNRIPATILQISRVQVVSVKTFPKHGYWAVQVGIGLRKPKNVTKAMLGHFAAAGVAPKEKLVEFRVRDESGLMRIGKFFASYILSILSRISNRCNPFLRRAVCGRPWKRVTVISERIPNNRKGKGFAGVMKRHGFHGLPASHGVSIKHRSGGSIGASQVVPSLG